MLHFFLWTINIKTSELRNELQIELDTFMKTITEEIEKTSMNNKSETDKELEKIGELIRSLEQNKQNDTIKSVMNHIKTAVIKLKKDVVGFISGENNKIVTKIDNFCCKLPENLQKQCSEVMTNCLIKKINGQIIEKELEEIVSAFRNTAKITNNINPLNLKEKLAELSGIIETTRSKLSQGVIDTLTEFNMIIESAKINPVVRHHEIKKKLSLEKKTKINQINDKINEMHTEFGLAKILTDKPGLSIERLVKCAEKHQTLLKLKEDGKKVRNAIKYVSIDDHYENLASKSILLELEIEKLQKNISKLERTIDNFINDNIIIIDDALINIEESRLKIKLHLDLLSHFIFIHCNLAKNNKNFNENEKSKAIYKFLRQNEILRSIDFPIILPKNVNEAIKNNDLAKDRIHRLIFIVHVNKEKILAIPKLASDEHVKYIIDTVDSFISECYDIVEERGVTKYTLKENINQREIIAAFRGYKIKNNIFYKFRMVAVALILFVFYQFLVMFGFLSFN